MSESRIALALRRIACGRVPTSAGETKMSRHEMMEMARLACEEIGLLYGFNLVWAPEVARARVQRATKRRMKVCASAVVTRRIARGLG